VTSQSSEAVTPAQPAREGDLNADREALQGRWPGITARLALLDQRAWA